MNQRDRAVDDLRRIFADARIWQGLAWIDIRSKYRYSTLGTFWITAATGVLAVTIGILYGQFFHQDMTVYLPYFATGFILWQFIVGAVTEASYSLIASGNFIKGSSLPIVFHVLRVTQKQLIVLAHNVVVLIAVWLFFRWPLTPTSLLSVLGLVLTFIFISATSLVTAMICVRFRDIPPLINATTQFLFFATPIMWDPAQLRFGKLVLELNPVAYFLIATRDPFLGRPVDATTWGVAVLLTLLSLVLAAFFYVRFRRRVAYWV